MLQKFFSLCLVALIFHSCKEEKKIPVIGFLDLLHDETLLQAKAGFYDALKENGFDETKKTIEIIYRNANNDQTSLLQACDYLVSKNVALIATNPTLSTIAAVQKTNTIPVFMMVSPHPARINLVDDAGRMPFNLYGVYETLDYIDTSVMLIRTVFPNAKTIGAIYNQSEPQSVDAFNEISKACEHAGLKLESLPVNNSNETQLVVQSLLRKKIDAFFALPDNIVFSSMEVIVSSCDRENIPVFTSEEGLVQRGALAAFGADMYQWGYQSGKQAAMFLKSGSTENISPEPVQTRKRVYNKAMAERFNVVFDETFTEAGIK